METLPALTEDERNNWSQATQNTLQTVPVPLPPEVVADFDNARDNLSEISITAMQAVRDAATFAGQTQNDKMYLALASLLRAANETQRDRLDLHDRKKKLVGTAGPRVITNNQTVVMTSSDMLKRLRGEEIK